MLSLVLMIALLTVAVAVAVAECRQLTRAVWLYAAQGCLVALMLLLGAAWSELHGLVGSAVTILVAKAVILPLLVMRYARQGAPAEESPPAHGYLWAGAAALLGFLAGQYGLPLLLAGVTGAAAHVPFGLAAGLGLVAAALRTILAHRDTLKVVLGVCLLENGAHLLMAAIAPTIPELVAIGVVLDVILAVWLLLVVGRRAEEVTGARDDGQLDQLRG